jgi:hypothetical protein
MTLVLPSLQVALKARNHDGPDEQWYRVFKFLVDQANQLEKAFGDAQGELGSAAFKDVGTSGDSVPLLNTANTFSKAQTFDVVTLTDAASISWDWSLGPIAKVTLTDDRVLAAPTGTNGKAGTWSLFVYQDGSGGHTLTLDAIYLPPDGEALELAAEAGKFDVITFVTDGTSIAAAISLNHKAIP